MKKITLVAVILLLTLLVVVGCAQPAAVETTKTVTTTKTVGAGATATVTAPAKTVTSTKTVTATVTAAPGAPEVYKWRMQTPSSRGSTTNVYAEAWADELRVVSGGQLDIEVFGVSDILPMIEAWDAVGAGSLDIVLSYASYWLGKTPVAAFSQGLPFSTRDRRDFKALLWELGIEDIIRAAYAEHNVYLVQVVPALYLSSIGNVPIRSVGDLKGMKFRSTGIIGDVLAEAGASATYFPVPEIYGVLERGVVDSITFVNPALQYDFAFHEVSKYVLGTPLTAAEGDEIIMNPDTWNGLPDNLKQMLLSTIGDFSDKMDAATRWEDTWKVEEMVEDWGIEVTYLSQEDVGIMAVHAANVYERYAAEDAHFADALKIMKDYMVKIGLLE